MKIVMHRPLVYVEFAVAALIPACQGQAVPDQLNPLSSSQRDGAHLYEVSVFSGYSTSANPYGAGQIASPGAAALGADENYGVSAAIGWQHHREKGNFSIRYSGAYSGLVHYSGANGYSQWLTLAADRKLAPKWNFTLSTTGQDATLIEVVNEPSLLSVTSQLPSDFNDFAAAFGLGSYSTAQAASMILGAPVYQAPIRALLLGNKVLNFSGNAGLTYSYSPHLSFRLSSYAAGGESRSASVDGSPAQNYVLPLSFGAEAGMNWSYSPSPRTDLGVSIGADRIQNHFQDDYTGTVTASAGRKMGMHWFAKIYGGATYTDVAYQLSGTPATLQAVGGGSLGVKAYGDTFAASYDRAASDTYGSVVGTYSTFSGTWKRSRPGSRLSMQASFGKQQVSNTGFESFSGWTGSAGIAERLTNNAMLSEQYVYFKTDGSYLGTVSNFSIQSVRVSMSWAPQTMQR